MTKEELKQLKEQGVEFLILTTRHTNQKGEVKYLKPVSRSTIKGIRNYIQKMWDRYGDKQSVEVGYFDDNLEYHIYTTYEC